MPGLDNKISNIIGTSIPTWLLKQLEARSKKNTLDSRDTQNILYLANKTAWIRLVSSINIAEQDISYFHTLGANISNVDDLAKNYVLFGGTSKYKGNNNRNAPSYDIRSGIKNDGAYNLLDNTEINDYGYRPMPGITGVSIETQGALGSIRGATINFKVWDKYQLDIMDALYFKLGFSMFLEWGHTYFYHSPGESPNIDPNVIYSTEDYSIDPFTANLKKEDIYTQISKNTRDSEGNYDAMLGVVTNFNFNYNEAGGFDCTLKLMSLGYLGDRIKINHSTTLPNILEAEIKQLNNVYKKIEDVKLATELSEQAKANEAELQKKLKGQISIFQFLNNEVNPNNPYRTKIDPTIFPTVPERLTIINEAKILNSSVTAYDENSDSSKVNNFKNFDYLLDNTLYLSKFGVKISNDDIENENIKSISLDKTILTSKLNAAFGSGLANPNDSTPTLLGYVDRNILNLYDYLYNTGDSSSDISEASDNKKRLKLSDNKKLFRIPNYSGNNKDSYGIDIVIDLPPDVNYVDKTKRFKLVLKDILENQNLNFTNVSFKTNKIGESAKYFLTLSGESPFDTSAIKTTSTQTQKGIVYTDKVETDAIKAKAKFDITITDSALISSIEKSPKLNDPFTEYTRKLNDQNKQQSVESAIENSKVSVGANQVHNAMEYMSSLEIMLRTIQVHSLGKAIEKSNDPEIKKEVFPLDLTKETVGDVSLIDQIFSTGIFKPFIQKLIDGTNVESGYPKENRLAVYAKYGFNTALLGGKTATKEDGTGLSLLKGKEVKYRDLLTSYVVPYQINQTVTEGTSLNHPVYIQLGALLMILNHMCTIYDTPNGSTGVKDQTPLSYIDFNPETNFCLSTNKHLSTNPFRFLIPFEGTFQDYKSLFNENLLDGDSIAAVSGTTETTPLFKKTDDKLSDDRLSGQIPAFKYDEIGANGNTSYKGKIMKVLVNIEYILQMVKQYSQKNETSNVYLKPFLEQIISDLNRSLGNYNLLRLAYNDSGNTFHIVDDQLTPGDASEDFISPDIKDEIPLYGKNSIGKNIQIKTDISTKLSNMIAISSNSNPGDKSALSTDGTSFGFINTGYVDRYINNKTEIEETSPEEKKKKEDENKKKEARINDTLIKQAITFNQTISDFYGTTNPSDSSVDQATNYYIQKMSKIKANDSATRASAMIPVSLNFTTDGISGMNMGQGFTISKKFLPYTYNDRNIPGVGASATEKVGFVVFGLTHNFENNQWNTDVRANMIYLKKIEDFKGAAVKAKAENKEFRYNENNVNFTSYNTLTNPVPNTKFSGVTTISADAFNGGPIEQRVVNIANDIFRTIKEKDPSIIIRVTAGNDKKHQEITEYTSFHVKGTALDFAISAQGAVPSDKHKQLVNTVLAQFKSKETGFGYIDEYNPKNQNKYNTGGHFHIYYSS